MSDIREYYEAGAMLLAYIGLIRATFIHNSTEKRELEHHQQELETLLLQHSKEIKLTKETYMKNMFVDMERHFQQLNADLLSATRASERDMYDQRNKQCQTLILAATIMLSSLISIIIQGLLPLSTPVVALNLYSISGTASLGSLFLCIIIYTVIILKCSDFMYRKRSREYNKVFSNFYDETKDVFEEHGEILTNRTKSIDSLDSSDHNEPIISYRRNNKYNFFEKISKKIGRKSNNDTFGNKLNNNNKRSNNDSNNDNDNNKHNIYKTYDDEIEMNDTISNSSFFTKESFMNSDLDQIDNKRNIKNNYDDEIFRADSESKNSTFNDEIFMKPELDEIHDSVRLTINDEYSNNDINYTNASTNIASLSGINFFQTPRNDIKRLRRVSNLDIPRLEYEYDNHDETIKNYLNNRDMINKRYTKLLAKNFDNFWNTDCRLLSQMGVIFFYVGTGLLLICLMTYNWVYFSYSYFNTIGAYISTAIIGASLVLGILFRFSFKVIQSKTADILNIMDSSKKYNK